jgi:alanine racemase
MALRAAAEVDLSAIRRNVERLHGELRSGAELCAVVKADGYGHGAVPAARAALAGGATRLAVATAEEAAELRRGGLAEVPILVMGALSAEELPVAVAAGAEVVAWDERFVEQAAREAHRRFGASQTSKGAGASRLPFGAGRSAEGAGTGRRFGASQTSKGAGASRLPFGAGRSAEGAGTGRRFGASQTSKGAGASRLPVHVKLDTGLGRLGTRQRRQAVAVARAVAEAEGLKLAGLMTHFATADGDLDFARRQLAAFVPFVEEVRAMAPGHLCVHAANSAAVLRLPEAHFDMVRCGIAIYGSDPMNEDPDAFGLEPALTLASYVAAVKAAAPGDSAGYGRRYIAAEPTWLATLPIGYGDGVARRLTNNCDVLIGGRRHPLVGTVSMDNITVDLGPEPVASVGDRAVLIGRDGPERITAEEVARRLDTISYEVLCAISRRVPRVYGEAT